MGLTWWFAKSAIDGWTLDTFRFNITSITVIDAFAVHFFFSWFKRQHQRKLKQSTKCPAVVANESFWFARHEFWIDCERFAGTQKVSIHRKEFNESILTFSAMNSHTHRGASYGICVRWKPKRISHNSLSFRRFRTTYIARSLYSIAIVIRCFGFGDIGTAHLCFGFRRLALCWFANFRRHLLLFILFIYYLLRWKWNFVVD